MTKKKSHFIAGNQFNRMHSVDGGCWPLAVGRCPPSAVRRPLPAARSASAAHRPSPGCQLWLSAFCLWLQNPICSSCCLLNVSANGQPKRSHNYCYVNKEDLSSIWPGWSCYLFRGWHWTPNPNYVFGHWFLRYVFALGLCIKMAKWHKVCCIDKDSEILYSRSYIELTGCLSFG